MLAAALCFTAGKEIDKLKIIFTEKAPKPIGPYSQALMKDDLIYLSGQIAINQATSQLDTSNIENETKQVMENIKAVLEAANLTTKNILKTTIYMTDLSKFKQVNEIYASYFKENPPARETVQVQALPKGAHVEISAVGMR